MIEEQTVGSVTTYRMEDIEIVRTPSRISIFVSDKLVYLDDRHVAMSDHKNNLIGPWGFENSSFKTGDGQPTEKVLDEPKVFVEVKIGDHNAQYQNVRREIPDVTQACRYRVELVLQWREKVYPTRGYGGRITWSEWQDVPIVEEE